MLVPKVLVAAASIALTGLFLAWTGLRVLGAATPWRQWPRLRTASHDLPLYSIIVALYDEACAVDGLVKASAEELLGPGDDLPNDATEAKG